MVLSGRDCCFENARSKKQSFQKHGFHLQIAMGTKLVNGARKEKMIIMDTVASALLT